MKKILFILIVTFTSCENSEYNSSSKLEKMKRPIMVMGIGKDNHSVVLRSADGEIWVGQYGFSISEAIAQSYKVGDTLK